MIVVADSGPLHYLILLGEAGLLEKLYGVVRIPAAVALELSAPGAPAQVSDWITNPPPWFVIEFGSESCQAGTSCIGERGKPSIWRPRCGRTLFY